MQYRLQPRPAHKVRGDVGPACGVSRLQNTHILYSTCILQADIERVEVLKRRWSLTRSQGFNLGLADFIGVIPRRIPARLTQQSGTPTVAIRCVWLCDLWPLVRAEPTRRRAG